MLWRPYIKELKSSEQNGKDLMLQIVTFNQLDELSV